LFKIDDIVDFRTLMRGREVPGAVYIVSEEGGIKGFDEPTNKLKPLSHVI